MIGKVICAGKWSAEISAEYGANVIRLQYDGEDVFVPLLSREQHKVNPYLQGSPILLPANRTKGGKFVCAGREYALPVNEPRTGAHLHGLVHRQKFEIIGHKSDSIFLRYVNLGEVYPFPFLLDVCYTCDDGFVQSYTVKNLGKTPLPLTFALHTTFVEPVRFSLPIDACQEKDEFHIPTGRYVPLSEQEAGYVTGSASKGLEISGYYRACGHTAEVGHYRYTVAKEFDHWILFNGRGESGLLCVEPQCGAVDGLNLPDGHRLIAPGQKLVLWTKLERKEG